MPLAPIEHPVRALERWTARGGEWRAQDGTAHAESRSGAARFESPPFEAPSGRLLLLELRAKADGSAEAALTLRRERDGSIVDRRSVRSDGDWRASVSFEPDPGERYRLELALFDGALRDAALGVLANSGELPQRRHAPDTRLAHWGPLRRALHRSCRRHRRWNAFVAALEMRLGREELVSLPQNVGLCPTGQCNALCEFCSVTIRRTGILKQEARFERLQSLLAPSAAALRMVGLEGNGEPTLHHEFDELVELATRDGASAYLITNGSRLRDEQIPLLLRLDSINVSLNAASAETHRKVMGLRDFDPILARIRALRAARGDAARPLLSVSCVVDADNAHEMAAFLRLAEYDLGVDRVLLRPLSELASDLGPAEDLRRIVPFESAQARGIAEAAAYLRETPRRCEVVFDPDAFVVSRRDPVSGAEKSAALPAARHWQVCDADAETTWPDERRVLVERNAGGPGDLLRSHAVPCRAGAAVSVALHVRVERGRLAIGLLAQDRSALLAETQVEPGEHDVTLEFQSVDDREFRVVLRAVDAAPLRAEVGWDTADEAVRRSERVGPRVGTLAPAALAAPSAPVSGERAPARFLCQKPWTDLANFSVDGRVDVCCIATGASQTRYALGNLETDSFQSIWNGERMREFRRRLHAGDPLPVCARCPMHFQYDGVFFDPAGTKRSASRRLGLVGDDGEGPARGPRRWARVALERTLDATLFRGFRR